MNIEKYVNKGILLGLILNLSGGIVLAQTSSAPASSSYREAAQQAIYAKALKDLDAKKDAAFQAIQAHWASADALRSAEKAELSKSFDGEAKMEALRAQAASDRDAASQALQDYQDQMVKVNKVAPEKLSVEAKASLAKSMGDEHARIQTQIDSLAQTAVVDAQKVKDAKELAAKDADGKLVDAQNKLAQAQEEVKSAKPLDPKDIKDFDSLSADIKAKDAKVSVLSAQYFALVKQYTPSLVQLQKNEAAEIKAVNDQYEQQKSWKIKYYADKGIYGEDAAKKAQTDLDADGSTAKRDMDINKIQFAYKPQFNQLTVDAQLTKIQMDKLSTAIDAEKANLKTRVAVMNDVKAKLDPIQKDLNAAQAVVKADLVAQKSAKDSNDVFVKDGAFSLAAQKAGVESNYQKMISDKVEAYRTNGGPYGDAAIEKAKNELASKGIDKQRDAAEKQLDDQYAGLKVALVKGVDAADTKLKLDQAHVDDLQKKISDIMNAQVLAANQKLADQKANLESAQKNKDAVDAQVKDVQSLIEANTVRIQQEAVKSKIKNDINYNLDLYKTGVSSGTDLIRPVEDVDSSNVPTSQPAADARPVKVLLEK